MDAYGLRVGSKTWTLKISKIGKDVLISKLKRVASKNTSIAFYSKGKIDPIQVIGSKKYFHNGQTSIETESEAEEDIHNSVESLHQKIISMSAFFHDIGKGESRGQSYFHSSTKSTRIDPNIDQIKHELSSFFLLRFFSIISKINEEDRKKEIKEVCDNGLRIKKNKESSESTFLNTHCVNKEVKKDFSSLINFSSNAKKNKLDFNVIVETLVLFHHKLSEVGSAGKFDKEVVGFNKSYLLGIKTINQNPYMPNIINFNFTEEELTSYFNIYMKKITEIENISNKINVSADIKLLEYLFQLGRMIVISSDHRASQLAIENEKEAIKNGKDIDLTGEIIAKSKKHGYQLLSAHLKEAETISNEIFELLHSNSFNSLKKEDSKYLLHKPANLNIKEKYQWQRPGIKFVEDNYSEGGLFCVVISSTGAGKTRFCAELASTITPELRLNVALGLRTLTLQTGTKYKDMYKLGDDKIVTQIGDILTKKIHDNHAGEKDQFFLEMNEEDEVDDFDLIVDQKENKNIESSFPECLSTSFDSFSKKRYLSSPIVISTVDYLVKAGDYRKSNFIVPQLRVISSDLLLDEVDGYDPEDSLSLIRLCYMAGLYGRKLYLSTATAMTSLIDILHKAFLDGYQVYAGANKKNKIVHSFLITDEKDKSGYMNIYNTSNDDSLISQYIEKYKNLIKKEETNHVVKIKNITLNESKEEFLQTIINNKSNSNNGRLGDFFNESISLSKNNYETSMNKYGQELKLSAGMIRVAHIQSGFQVVMELLQDVKTYKKIKPRTKINIIFYHSSMSIQSRGYVEKAMDETLNREEGNYLINSPIFRKQANKIDQESKDGKYNEIITIFVVTPVEEVGRDHDFDWAIVEPSSLRSIIQTNGRVNRHRMNNIDTNKPNIIIMNKNIALQQNKGRIPVYCFPGFETKESLFEDDSSNRDIQNITISEETKHTIQFKSIDVLFPQCILAKKEDLNLRKTYSNYYNHFKNIKHKMFYLTYDPLYETDNTGVFTEFRKNTEDGTQENSLYYMVSGKNNHKYLTRDEGFKELSAHLLESYSLDFIDISFEDYCNDIMEVTGCNAVDHLLDSVTSKKDVFKYAIFFNKHIGIIFLKK